MTEDLVPLRNAISRELHAQYELRSEQLTFEDLPEIAYAVAANLAKEFHVERIVRPVPDQDDPNFGDRDLGNPTRPD
jgi:hypothetical protein